MKNIIYGLKDPRNDVYQYIGKSTVGDVRALSHLTKSHSPNVNEWVKTLNDKWLYPIVEIIEVVEGIDELPEREKYHIDYYHNINPNLLNIQLVETNINETRSEEDESDFNTLFSLITKIPTMLKNERIYRKLTQNEVAKEMSVSRSTVSLCENGSNVGVDLIKKYLLALKGFDLITKQKSKRAKR
jgi:DNA-binding XRE family transcriptional regulator